MARIMGVLNVTPDSFSDGGEHRSGQGSGAFRVALESALRSAEQMLLDGADLIDVGGESTRPGAAPVSPQQELDRVLPVVEALVTQLQAVVSVDTSTPQVMRAAVAAGASMINDVRALGRDGARSAAADAADAGVQICLMHMQGEPGTMQQDPHYDDVVEDVYAFLAHRVADCELAGIPRGQLLIDPGFGFGKTLQHNYQLLAGLRRFHDLGLPLLVGMSRKSMIGQVTGRPVDQRVHGSVAAASAALLAGADIIRVHDVAATRDALLVCEQILANA